MTTFAVQYLGSRPKDATPASVRRRLREACQRLPISMVLLDWDLPPAIEEAVAEEALSQKTQLYRWQTWLTGDSRTDLPLEWAAVGLDGIPIPGHAGDPDFTFICPNNPFVEDFLAKRMESIATRGLFQGIFLDRIRFPSPAPNPSHYLGCFCRHCQRLAAKSSLDLPFVRSFIQSLVQTPPGAQRLARSLLGQISGHVPLEAFLVFRQESITRCIKSARKLAESLGLQVGLDCFSPALTRMVGQDLTGLKNHSDWIKIMTYPRVFGPAGISFELLDLLNWLVQSGIDEQAALACIQESTGLAMPHSQADLRGRGLEPQSVAREVQRGRDMGVKNLLAGIALVEVPGIHESTPAQIQADLECSRRADGLVLSWDLWQIPLENLDTIRQIWEIR
jgi:hypothetical protein